MGDIHIEWISLIDTSLHELQLEKALSSRVFWLAVVPELLAKWYSRHNTTLPQSTLHADAAVDYDLSSEDEEDDGIWCYCKTIKRGATHDRV